MAKYEIIGFINLFTNLLCDLLMASAFIAPLIARSVWGANETAGQRWAILFAAVSQCAFFHDAQEFITRNLRLNIAQSVLARTQLALLVQAAEPATCKECALADASAGPTSPSPLRLPAKS
jgi:hypothetical protein